MKVLGVIPARYGSTRFAGKPLADICGKPMIVHVWERASRATRLDSLLVATDDDRIVSAVERFGGKAVLTSPNHQSGTERAAEVAERYPEFDIVANVQGDEPLIDPRVIDQVIEAILPDPSIAMTTAAKLIKDESKYSDPNVVKVVTALNGNAMYFSRSLVPYPRVKEGFRVYEHVGIYCYRRALLIRLAAMPQTPLERCESLEQLRLLENGYPARVVLTEFGGESLSVDTPDDLEIVRAIVSRTMDDGR